MNPHSNPEKKLQPWEIVSSKYLVKDRWLKLRADSCRTSTGHIVEPYYISEFPDWVHVAAFDDDNRLLLTRQYRHGTQAFSIELPSGMMDPGEDPKTAVLRELSEETGARVSKLHQLTSLDPNPARQNNNVYSFAATGAQIVDPQKLDPSEEIEFFFTPLTEALQLIESGQFKHALHVATLFLAMRKLDLLC